jgi:hypothetical protein
MASGELLISQLHIFKHCIEYYTKYKEKFKHWKFEYFQRDYVLHYDDSFRA